jgi:transcriptional regulator with XRE-family HTH domain
MKNLFFAGNLKYLRLKNKLGWPEILSSIDIKRTTWSGYENKKSFPSLADFIRIAEYFDILENELLHSDLSQGGDYEKKEVHKMYRKGGDEGGDEGGDSQKKDGKPEQNGPYSQAAEKIAFLEALLSEKTATIADLRERITELKQYNSSLQGRLDDLLNSTDFNTKRRAAG